MCMTWSGDTFFFVVVDIYDMSMRGRDCGWHRNSILLFLGMLYLVCLILKAGSGREAEEADGAITAGVEKPKLAITFDDGPDAKTTALLLDGLKARKVRATFFVIGEKAEQNPELICRMSEEGHLIGNHTYSHVQLNMLSSSQACSQVKAANDVIKEITGQEVIYLRPQYGEWDHKKDCPQNMIAVYWDVDPLDWKRTDTKQIAADILRQVKPGDIILLHDIYKTSVQAAFIVIDELQAWDWYL